MVRRDMAAVLEIESKSFKFAWDEKTFIQTLRERMVVAFVVALDEVVVGYMITNLQKDYIELLNLAVSPSMRRQGVGKLMIDKMKEKLSFEKRQRLVVDIVESNLQAQLFFKANEFLAVDIIKNSYVDTKEDAYQMVYDHIQSL